jgi:sulfate adenylyltransferase subunit 1
VSYIPLSALTGDNVVESLGGMPWYQGQTILEHLKSYQLMYEKESRFQFKPLSDKNKKNTTILEAMPENCMEIISKLAMRNGAAFFNRISGDKYSLFDKQFEEAAVGSSITIELENDINVTRGDMIVKSSELPKVEKDTTVCWMDSKS